MITYPAKWSKKIAACTLKSNTRRLYLEGKVSVPPVCHDYPITCRKYSWALCQFLDPTPDLLS